MYSLPFDYRAMAVAFWLVFAGTGHAQTAEYVIHISVDCLRPAAVEQLVREGKAPSFQRLQAEGAFTHNARTDFDSTNTLPNHTTQLTGRGVLGPEGHNWPQNSTPEPGLTLHAKRGSYVAGVFDVAHDHGLRTGAYVTKGKFSFLRLSYDAEHGGDDVTDADNGKSKTDAFLTFDPRAPNPAGRNSDDLVAALIPTMRSEPYRYVFIHFTEVDNNAHGNGVSDDPDSPYMKAVEKVDGWVGQVLNLVDTDPKLKGKTAVVLTADHGGVLGEKADTAHKDPANPQNYTVPLYVWGPGIGAGDLYAANRDTRQDPGSDRPNYDGPANEQPFRNGDVANLCLQLLGLPAVPGSTIGEEQNIRFPKPAR